VPIRPSASCVTTVISVPDLDHRYKPSSQGNGTSVSWVPFGSEMNEPWFEWFDSSNLENRRRPGSRGPAVSDAAGDSAGGSGDAARGLDVTAVALGEGVTPPP